MCLVTVSNAQDTEGQHTVMTKRSSPIDWEAMFSEWLDSGLNRADFLSSKGFDYIGGTVSRNTSDWDNRLRQLVKDGQRAADALAKCMEDPQSQVSQRVEGYGQAIVDGGVDRGREAVKQSSVAARLAGAMAAETMLPKQGDSSWELIMKWRANQALDDWKTADQIKNHVKLVLQKALRKQKTIDQETGEIRYGYETELIPVNLRQLAVALLDVQRIQRLALGLSTENIGLDSPDSNIERAEGADAHNVFQVEMSKGGRFLTARPRRAKSV